MESDDTGIATSMLQYAVIAAATGEKAKGWYEDSGYF